MNFLTTTIKKNIIYYTYITMCFRIVELPLLIFNMQFRALSTILCVFAVLTFASATTPVELQPRPVQSVIMLMGADMYGRVNEGGSSFRKFRVFPCFIGQVTVLLQQSTLYKLSVQFLTSYYRFYHFYFF